MRRASLILAPVQTDGAWTAFDVDLTVELSAVPAGEPLFAVPDVVVSIPGTAYATEDFSVADDRGALAIRELPVADGLGGTWRRWAADRESEGPLRVRAVAPTRPIDAQTPVGPLFDLRSEDLGLFGAGVAFLPLPPASGMPSFTGADSDETFDIRLSWRIDDGVQAISSRGLDDQRWEGSLQTLRFAYYAAGTPISVPGGDSPFGLHAFAQPPFELDEIADYLRDLLVATSSFFDDETPEYRVLIRKNPSAGTGGTALPGSFAFGFSATEESDPDALRSLLAHEMTHNWPHLDADPAAASWYSEGMAEYYSHVIPLRAGLLSPERFAAQLSDRHRGYDTNPLRTLSNVEANDLAWIDPRAQRIPYGRGLAYLIATDAAIRAATGGDRSLDDVAVGIVRAQRAGEQVSIDGWIERVSEALGADARPAYESMAAGESISLEGIELEGCAAGATTAPELELGFDIASYRSEGRLVQGVLPGSAAAAAGLRDGDALVARQMPHHMLRRSDRPLEIEILRDGAPHTIRYIPAGEHVPTTEWSVSRP